MAAFAVWIMTVSITIPVTHWGYTRGQKKLESDSSTLADVMLHLHGIFPDLNGHIVDGDQQRLCPGIEVAVNDALVLPFDPAYKLDQGDKVRISSIITGG